MPSRNARPPRRKGVEKQKGVKILDFHSFLLEFLPFGKAGTGF